MTTSPLPRPVPIVSRRHAGLGTNRLFWAFTIVLGLQMLFDLFQAGTRLEHDEQALLHVTMWIVLLVSDGAITVVSRVLGNHLPSWLYWMFVAALSLVTLMDLVSVWDGPDPGGALTAGISAAVSLVLAVTTRSAAEIIATLSGLTALLVVGLALCGGFAGPGADPDQDPAADSVLALCQAFFVVMAATLVMAEFRRIVRRELEQTLSHSTLTAPRLTVGADQSTKLARLDLAAESLLAAVAEGRVRLPLSQEIARRAGQLATELRLHLLESRSKTWLDLAITESETLSAAITVEDPSSSAGLLGTRQRGALLSALWLLVDGRSARGRSATAPATVEIAPPAPATATTPSSLRITVTVPWAGRSGVDPGVWEHFAQVGRYLEANAGHGLAVEIRSLVPGTGLLSSGRDRNGAVN